MIIINRALFLLTFLMTGCSGSENDDNRSTDVLFAAYISTNVEEIKSSDKYLKDIEGMTLIELKENSFKPNRSLIVTLVNLMDSFEVDDKKVRHLLDLLIRKGEPIVVVDKHKCNFVDQLIMKGDVNIFRNLLDRGLRLPEDDTCTVDVIEKYKFRYSEEGYEEVVNLISG